MDDDEEISEQRDDDERRTRFRRTAVRVLLALVLVGAGLAGGVIWGERRAMNSGAAKSAPPARSESKTDTMPGMPGMAKPGSATGARQEEVVEVSLAPDVIERAGIKIAEVKTQVAGVAITVPATVTSNAYRDTKVNALVGGIVRQVTAELGASVDRGQPLAVIFSAELADAQMKYLSMRAMVHADHQKRQRTERLVALGAASRQELEEVTATHVAHETEVAAARQRLLLLGLSTERVATLESASQVVSEVTVPSPAAGLVVGRAVNPGQVVGAGHELFVVTDLSSVWVIGDLYEKDFPSVRIGTPASVTVPSAPNAAPVRGRVAYIDPRVEAATRTAKVRVEVPNRNRELRLGMFVTATFETGPTQRVAVVPRTAVQTTGERTVVYVPVEGEGGKFAERPVKLGSPVGDVVQILEGLKPGDKVVTEGSFLLRAEAARNRS